MKIQGTITILINRDYTQIEVEDRNAGVTFLKVKLTPEQLSSALARIAYTDCAETIVTMLDNIGKKQENKRFEFEVPKELTSWEIRTHSPEKLRDIAQKLLDKQGEGWIAENYFSSQDSFFDKDGKHYARCAIRRWI